MAEVPRQRASPGTLDILGTWCVVAPEQGLPATLATLCLHVGKSSSPARSRSEVIVSMLFLQAAFQSSELNIMASRKCPFLLLISSVAQAPSLRITALGKLHSQSFHLSISGHPENWDTTPLAHDHPWSYDLHFKNSWIMALYE